MSVLHAYFHLRKQNEFQRCLEQTKAATASSNTGQVSSSGGSGQLSHSWSRLSSLSAQAVDVNTRDSLGRTVLHLACSALDPAALEFARLLLQNPHINVNIQDQESHWTALHRALYAGNISAAVLLAQRPDTDMFMKDVEGYTPFDLYNSTVEGTNPPKSFSSRPLGDLYTWGSNRNATLGLGDGGDRSLPEQVVIKRDEVLPTASPCERLKPLSVVGIAMSKLHTTVITNEPKNNLRSCGFANDGRLGPSGTSSHAQFSLINPQKSLSHNIISIALGQDHTLAVTASGEILSWGLNRFAQLGYVIEGSGRTLEAQIQSSARKITGALRNQVVIGVACCKTASACWTSKQLFTWGTNGGQLGYEKAAQPQILPRLVPYVSEPVLAVAMTDSAMLVLLANREVLCIHDGIYWKLQFTTQRRASKPINKERVEIQKITACEGSVGSFALVSEIGDVYLFNVEETSNLKKDSGDKGSRRPSPQLVWAVRRQFLAVRDIALGTDGSMILCTNSGHVFTRSRVSRAGINLGTGGPLYPNKNAASFKFQRIPNLQRIYTVAANTTGGFAALRTDAAPIPIRLDDHTLSINLDQVQPFRSVLRTISFQQAAAVAETLTDEDTLAQSMSLMHLDEEDDNFDSDIAPDIKSAMDLCRLLVHASTIPVGLETRHRLSEHYGATIRLKIKSSTILIHRSILLARVPALGRVLNGERMQCADDRSHNSPLIFDGKGNHKGQSFSNITIRGCHPMTILILCHYLYTDRVVAIWDRRVALAICDRYGNLGIDTSVVKDELRRLASSNSLKLPFLETAAQSAGKVSPAPSLSQDLTRMFNKAQESKDTSHDVVLVLRDRRIKAHSAILRARSPYFSTFFDEDCWTAKRLENGSGVIEVDLGQFDYRPMSYLFRYLYADTSVEIFDDIDFTQTTDQLVDFLFEIISCSNHLLMDSFTKICSSVVLQLVDLLNVSSILVDAVHFNALALVESLHGYMAKNLETLMEMHALDDLPLDVLKGFSVYSRKEQIDYHPYIRKGGNIAVLERRWASWLALQDIPIPFVPKYLSSGLRILAAPTPKEITSVPMTNVDPRISPSSSPRHPRAIPSSKVECEDEIFPMDGDSSTLAVKLSSSPASSTSRVWKSPSVSHKIDMKSIIQAEQLASDANKQQRTPVVGSRQVPSTKRNDPIERSMQGVQSPSTLVPLQRTPPTTQSMTSTSPHQSTLPTTAKQLQLPSTSSRHASSPWNTTTDALIPMSSRSRPPLQPIETSSPVDPSSNYMNTKPSATKVEHGPLIVPTKVKPPTNLPIRRTSSGEGKAWSSPTQTMPLQSNLTRGLSFQAIQEQQATKPLPRGPPKSLRQIQEEEQEVAFLAWFEEESAKVQKQEAAILSNALSNEQPREQRGHGNRHGQGKRGERGHGRGRGRGRGKEQSSSSMLVS